MNQNAIYYNFFLIFFLFFFFQIYSNPKISIITSIYKGEKFIKGFLEDITQQTIFNKCELILINANSPENEELEINKYLSIYSNIKYIKLKTNLNLYATWNYAIKIATGEYITNANLDDRLALNCYEIHSNELDNNTNIDLVYSDSYQTEKPNETFENNSADKYIIKPEFSKEALKENCLPSFNPMWRKNMHYKYRYFDENFDIVGDWEFWIRAVKLGSKFKKVEGIYGLYFFNPNGLSTNWRALYFEREKLFLKHKNFFN